MKRTVMRVCLSVLLAATVAAGCGQAAAPLENPMRLAVTDRNFLRKGIDDVLQGMFFEVEMPPRSEERIDTAPLVSAYPFEFWRPDTVGPRQHAESTLSTIRRKVTVSVTPTGTGSDVAVAVEKQRLSAPGSESSLVGQTYSLYGVSPTSMYRQDELEPPGGTWLDEGRDAELEQVILSRIYDRLGRPLPPS